MAERRITAFFDTYDEAARAVQRLEAAHMPDFEISLISNNFDDAHTRHATRSFDEESSSHEFAGATAAAGSVAGAGAGLLAGLGTVAVPGFGPIIAAGWIVSTLVGAGAGAAVGGLGRSAGGCRPQRRGCADLCGGCAQRRRSRDRRRSMTRRWTGGEDPRRRGRDRDGHGGREEEDAPAPPIGAAASTTTGSDKRSHADPAR